MALLLVAGGFATIRLSALVYTPVVQAMPAGVLLDELQHSPENYAWDEVLQRLDHGELDQVEVEQLIARSTSYLDSVEDKAPSSVLRIVLFNAMNGDEKSRQSMLRYMSLTDIYTLSDFIVSTWGDKNAMWTMPFVIDCLCNHASDEVRVQAIMTLRANKAWIPERDAYRALKCGIADRQAVVRDFAMGLIMDLNLGDGSIVSLLEIAEKHDDEGVRAAARAIRGRPDP